MKKIISILILALFSFSIMSCTKKPIIIDDNEDDINFRGADFIVYQGWHSGIIATEKGSSASADREFDRYTETENKFNLVFNVQVVENPPAVFLTKALSGGLSVDLLRGTPLHIYDSCSINTLIPAENIVNDITSEKWKTSGHNDSGIFNGKKYGIFPYYWETSPTISGFININMTILREYGIQTPHEIIEAGEWDWANFKSFLQQTTFNDGTTVWEGLGMYGSSGETMLPFVLGNGGSYIVYENGRYKAAIDSEQAIEALQYAQSLVTEGLMNDIPVDNIDFYNGTRWMLASGRIMTSEDYDIAPIRYPYGPRGNKDLVSTISNGDFMYAFPIFSAYSEDEIGAVVEYLFEPLSDLYPNGWKDIYEDNVFFYHEDYEYYLRSIDEATYLDNAALTESYFEFRYAMRYILLGTSTPEAAIESVIDIIQADLDEHYNK